MNGSGGQHLRSRLAFHTHTATEDWAGCWLQVPGSGGGMRDEVGKDSDDWRLGMGTPVGQNTMPSAEGPWQICWLSVSLVAKTAGVLCRASHPESWSFLPHGSVFFPVPSCPCISVFAPLQKGSFMQYPKGLGKLVADLAFPFPGSRTLYSWGVPSWC